MVVEDDKKSLAGGFEPKDLLVKRYTQRFYLLPHLKMSLIAVPHGSKVSKEAPITKCASVTCTCEYGKLANFFCFSLFGIELIICMQKDGGSSEEVRTVASDRQIF